MDDLDQLTRRHTVQCVERTGRVAALIDLQAPRQRRRPTVELLIEVVAQAADGLRQNDSRRERVTEGRQRNALLAAPYPRTDAAQRHRPPDAKTAVPDPQRPRTPRPPAQTARPPAQSRAISSEGGPPVRDHVIEPSTDQAERHGPQRNVVDDPRLAATGHPPPVAEHQRHHDPDDDEQRIRPQGHRAEMPNTLRRAGYIGQVSRRHAVILCRTPSASSAVSDRTAGIPSFNANTNADPTITPSA